MVARLAKAYKGEEKPTVRQAEITLEGMHYAKLHRSSGITRVGQNVNANHAS